MNKLIKKIACTVILLICLISLCSCVQYFNYDYETLKETVESVEIIEYASRIDSPTGEEKEVLLATIDQSEQNQFLLDFSEIQYNYFWGHPWEPRGICIKLNYTNGESEIIGYKGTTKHGLINCDKTEFDELIQKYLG